MFEKIPALDPDNQAFWTGGEHGQLLICHCPDCGTYHHPPRPICSSCGQDHIEYRPVSGKGEVVTFTVNWQPWTPDQEVPFILAVVELVEQKGLWLMTNLIDCPIDEAAIGLPVDVDFVHKQGVWLPVFRPREHP